VLCSHLTSPCVNVIISSIVAGFLTLMNTCLFGPSNCIVVTSSGSTCSFSWIHSWMSYVDIFELDLSNAQTIVSFLSCSIMVSIAALLTVLSNLVFSYYSLLSSSEWLRSTQYGRSGGNVFDHRTVQPVASRYTAIRYPGL
jgi:hypothetical protein